MDAGRVEVRSLEEARQHLASFAARLDELERSLRAEQDYRDTFVTTPWWKRLLFALDGWPLYRLADAPQWRPWRRWWTS